MRKLLALIILLSLSGTARAQFTSSSLGSSATPSGQDLTSSSFIVPAIPNIVLVSYISYKTVGSGTYTPSLTSVTSSTGDTYIATASSPAVSSVIYNGAWVYAKINATPGATTITANGVDASSTPYVIMAHAFSVAGGNAVYDQDLASVVSSAATPVNTPAITPTHTGSLVYATAAIGGGLNGVNSPWILGNDLTSGQGELDADVLSSSGTVTVSFNDNNNPDSWASIAAAFYIASTNVIAPRRIMIY